MEEQLRHFQLMREAGARDAKALRRALDDSAATLRFKYLRRLSVLEAERLALQHGHGRVRLKHLFHILCVLHEVHEARFSHLPRLREIGQAATAAENRFLARSARAYNRLLRAIDDELSRTWHAWDALQLHSVSD